MANKRKSLPLTPTSGKDRLLGGRCLGCLQSDTVPLKLSFCQSTHEEPGKTCSFCPGWHHTCLIKAGSEEIQRCNWCNTYVQLGISAYKLPIQCLLAVGEWMANNRHTIPPVEFHTHTLILESRLFECNGEAIEFTLSRDKKSVAAFPKASYFTDLLEKATAAGDVQPLPFAVSQEGSGLKRAVQEEGAGDGDLGDDMGEKLTEDGPEESENLAVESAQRGAAAGDAAAGAAAGDAAAGAQVSPPPAPPRAAESPASPPPVHRPPANYCAPRAETVDRGDLLAVPREHGSGTFIVGRVKHFALLDLNGLDKYCVVVATGDERSAMSFLRVANYVVEGDCTIRAKDDRGILNGNVLPYELCNTKSLVSNLVHENRDWATYGIEGYKVCGHAFYFGHR
jgi:hypothetical protein